MSSSCSACCWCVYVQVNLFVCVVCAFVCECECEYECVYVGHTSYLLQAPRVYSCKFFLAGGNFYRMNAKNWYFRQILREKVAFFYRFNAKNWRFSV